LAFALQKLLSLEVIILHSSFARMGNTKPGLDEREQNVIATAL
jgi:hypothetical protein